MQRQFIDRLIPLIAAMGFSFFNLIARADEFSQWRALLHGREAYILGNYIKVTYAQGLFVAVGGDGAIGTSTNGIDWAPEQSPTTALLNNVLYGERFVASGGTVVASQDGHHWQSADFPGQTVWALAYGNEIYVAIDFYGSIYRSTNALQWATAPQPAPGSAAHMAFGNGLFLAVGAGGYIITSTNGLDWAERESGTTGSLTSIAFGDGKFVAVGSEGGGNGPGFILTSFNGIDWLYQAVDSTVLTDVTYGDGQFLAFSSSLSLSNGGSYSSSSFSSSDGIYFSSSSGDSGIENTRIMSGVCGNGVCVGVGSGPYYSTDGGQTWILTPQPVTVSINRFAEKDGTLVGVGEGSKVVTSTNGVEFSTQVVGDVPWYAICAAEGQFVALGASGTLASSTDGYDWTIIDSATTRGLVDITYGAGQFVAVASEHTGGKPYNFVVTSTNGVDWVERRPFYQTYLARSIAYGAGWFVVLGIDGNHYISDDGVSWITRPTGIPSNARSVHFFNNRFVVQYDGGFCFSSDALQWENQTVDLPVLMDLTYGNGIYLGVDYSHTTLWSSPDCVTWTKIKEDGANFDTVIYALDSFYVGGGVWKSRSSLVPSLEQIFQNNEQLDANVFGKIGRDYELQSSTDLKTWGHETDYNQGQRVQPLTLPAGPDQKFYRVKLKEP